MTPSSDDSSVGSSRQYGPSDYRIISTIPAYTGYRMSQGDDRVPDPRSELPYEGLLMEAPFGVLVVDIDSTIRYANHAVTEILGYDSGELLEESLAELIPGRLEASHFEAFGAYLETGQRHLEWDRIELPGLHRNGHEVPIAIAFRELSIEGEQLFAGMFTEISERSRLENEFEASVDALHELYVIASDSTLSFERRRESVLELGCEFLDLPYGFVTEITATEQTILAAVGDHGLLQPGGTCPIEKSYCRRTVESEGFLAVADAVEEEWGEDPAYERFELGSYIGGKLVVEGELFGTLCFASHDPRGRPFTDSERTFVELASRWLGYELQQRQQRERLERQNERLDRFASRASHDLRNPLSAAKGRLELAHDRYGDDEDIEAALGSLSDADERIEEMLEFARLGEAVSDPEPVPLVDAAETAFERVSGDGATMTVVDGVELRGDRDRIERLLENLFRNSVEHCESGVAVTLGALSSDPGFYVEDDGCGIPEPEREAVLESGYTTSGDGSGFGLAIVTEIAAAHGWGVRLEQSDDGGARFEFVP